MRRQGLIMLIVGWMTVGGLIWWGMDALTRPNAHLAGVTVLADEVVLKRDRSGHYIAPGRINGHAVTFLVDTGATQVAVPLRVAERIGLKPGAAFRAHTASGVATAYATRLDSVDVGGLIAHDVAGSILPDMPGEGVLLGMSYLSRFEVRIEGREMRLRARQAPSRPG